jgi:DNA mismatch endonuclease (patch repair protein)
MIMSTRPGDRLSPVQRSAHMAKIKRSDTKPERIVRRALHALGYRFRLQWKGAPGRPDVAFPGRRKIIFVHGCFWHQHEGCRLAHVPTTRREFWAAKFERNRARDARDLARAQAEGWFPLVVWECETRDVEVLSTRLAMFLGATKAPKAHPVERRSCPDVQDL